MPGHIVRAWRITNSNVDTDKEKDFDANMPKLSNAYVDAPKTQQEKLTNQTCLSILDRLNMNKTEQRHSL